MGVYVTLPCKERHVLFLSAQTMAIYTSRAIVTKFYNLRTQGLQQRFSVKVKDHPNLEASLVYIMRSCI